MLSRSSRLVLCLIFALGYIFCCADSSILSNKSAISAHEAVPTTFYPDVFSEVMNTSDHGPESTALETNATNTSAREIDQKAVFYVKLRAIFGTFIIELLTSAVLVDFTKNYTKYLESKLLLVVGIQVFCSFIFFVGEFFSVERKMIFLPLVMYIYFDILMVLLWDLLASTNSFFLRFQVHKYRALSINGYEVTIESPMIFMALFCVYPVIFSLVIECSFYILEKIGAYSPKYYEIDGFVFDIDFFWAVPVIVFLLCVVFCTLFYPTVIFDSEKRVKTVKLYLKTIFVQSGLWFMWIVLLQRRMWFMCKLHHTFILVLGICLAINIYRKRQKDDDEETEHN